MIGDFPATARLQRAFNDLAVFRGLVWLLVAGMIFQAAFLVHSASTFRSILNKANAHAVLLSGLSLCVTFGTLALGTASLMASPGHKPLQQISAYPNLGSAFSLSNPLTGILLALAVASQSYPLRWRR